MERQKNEKPDTSWKRIAKACKETALRIVGTKRNGKKQTSSPIVQELSKKQKKLMADKESSQNKEHRRKLKKKEK